MLYCSVGWVSHDGLGATYRSINDAGGNQLPGQLCKWRYSSVHRRQLYCDNNIHVCHADCPHESFGKYTDMLNEHKDSILTLEALA